MFQTLCLLGLLLFAGTPQSERGAGSTGALLEGVLRGIGAERVGCPVEVLETVDLHAMKAVCGRFEGDFASFELRWARQLELVARAERMERYGEMAPTRPHTDWLFSNGYYERIYTVGASTVGVRFDRGEIILVYK